VHPLNVPWGEPVHLEALSSELQKHPHIKAVLTQACETSTGTLHPVNEIARLSRQHAPQALIMIDAITALGATPLFMDDWDLDVVIAGSQKAFMLPTGLAFLALSERAWKATQTARLPRFYFDLTKELESNRKGETLFSSAVAMIKALDRVLWRFAGEKLEHQRNRCFAHAEVTREMASEFLGLKAFSQAPSPSVTALSVPKEIDGQKLRQHLEKTYNITVMGGQDQLKGKILRVGHLGYMTHEDVVQTLLLLGRSLNDLGLKISDSRLEAMTQAAETRVRAVVE
jgi:aspartate aminotransferase-like enzyme